MGIDYWSRFLVPRCSAWPVSTSHGLGKRCWNLETSSAVVEFPPPYQYNDNFFYFYNYITFVFQSRYLHSLTKHISRKFRFIAEAVEMLDEHLDVKGLFRRSGSTARLRDLRVFNLYINFCFVPPIFQVLFFMFFVLCIAYLFIMHKY